MAKLIVWVEKSDLEWNEKNGLCLVASGAKNRVERWKDVDSAGEKITQNQEITHLEFASLMLAERRRRGKQNCEMRDRQNVCRVHAYVVETV